MKKVIFFVLTAWVFTGCKDDPEVQPVITDDYTHGVFVLNEGAFGSNNASIDHISNGGTFSSDPYFDVNGNVLGDVLQSLTFIDGKGYAVLNNSQRVTVFDVKTFDHLGEITGVDYPRYMISVGSNRAYISNGSMAGDIKIVNLATNTITGSIPVGNGPEKMLKYGDYVFVCNSGGWSTDHTVSIISTFTDEVVETLEVGDRPVDLTIDLFSNLWVICSGETLYDEDWNVIGHTDAEMFRIDALNHTVMDSFVIGDPGDHPRMVEISMNQAVLYYENGGIYSVDVSAPSFPGTFLIGGIHNGLAVNPANGDIWTAGPADFVSPSHVRQHNLSGTELKEFTVGIGTNGFAFH